MRIPVKTWGCDNCAYSWQFSGEAANTSPYELNDWQLRQQFPERSFDGLKAGDCPSCHARGVKGTLGLIIDPALMSTIEVATDEALEATMVEELDEFGQPVMIQTSERYELRVNQQTGEIYSEAVPVMEPKMRELTTKELNDLKAKRNHNLDELDKVAV